MSILIKGMEMPTSCDDCPLENFDENYYGNESNHRCPLIYKGYTSNNRYDKRRDDCPLANVPPHGDLIDRDALMHEFEKAERAMQQHGREYSCSFMSSSQELSTEWYCVEDMLENAPTIIEEER